MTTETLPLLFMILLTPVAVYGLYYEYICRPRNVRRKLHGLPDFRVEKIYVGKHSGLAVDFSRRRIAYSDDLCTKSLPVSEIVDFNHIWDIVSDGHGNERHKNHRVVVDTSDYDLRVVCVPYWFKHQAEECRVSLLKLFQSQAQQNQEEFIETIKQQAGTKNITNSQTSYSQSFYQTDNRTTQFQSNVFNVTKASARSNASRSSSTGDKQKTVSELQELLKRHGYKHIDEERDIETENDVRTKFDKATSLIFDEFGKGKDFKIPFGQQRLIEEALWSFFGKIPKKPDSLGYTRRTISNYVSANKKYHQGKQAKLD